MVGAGGLGCPAALYLAASGIGRLTLADPDMVDLTNLQRHLENLEKIEKQEADKATKSGAKPKPAASVPTEPQKPIELGSKDDFQLAQALNYLKGEPVVKSPPPPPVAENKPTGSAN